MLLVLIVALFFGSAVVAGALRFSGWRPRGMKNHGELLQPPGDLRDAHAAARRRQRVSLESASRAPGASCVAPPADCGAACVALSRDLDTVWQLLGRDADRVARAVASATPARRRRAPPGDAARCCSPIAALRDAPAARRRAPATASACRSTWSIPNGFVILRYAPGFDPAGLRTDLARLLKLK